MGFALVMNEDVGWIEPCPLDPRPQPSCLSSPVLTFSSGREAAASCQAQMKGWVGKGLTPRGPQFPPQMACFWHLVTGRQTEPLPAPLLRAGVGRSTNPLLAEVRSQSQFFTSPSLISVGWRASAHSRLPPSAARKWGGGHPRWGVTALRLSPGSALWPCAQGPSGVVSAAGESFLHPDNKCPSGTWRGQGNCHGCGQPTEFPGSARPHTNLPLYLARLRVEARKGALCQTLSLSRAHAPPCTSLYLQ